MSDPACPPGLDAYLRLNRASSGEWRRALRQLLGSQQLQCRGERRQAVFGSLSALETDSGVICMLNTAQRLSLGDGPLPASLVMMVVEGGCQLQLDKGVFAPVQPVASVGPGQTFTLTIEPGSRVMLVYPLSGRVAASPAKAESLLRFLYRAEFFGDYRHACQSAGQLFAELEDGGSGPACEHDVALFPPMDRRLARAVAKIRDEHQWAFNLQELASHSGASERNLYYLMKRETGLTPYRFYQRCRLVRVRRRLVDCQCDIPHVSWYAANEGFSHLGRFAALYRQHFGELPSETVLWRRQLQDGFSSAYSSAAEPW